MLKKNLFILICLIKILIVSAQTDTITYAECEIDTIPTQYDKLLKFFLIEKEDVNHLWKFNGVDWGALNPSIAFEQKIKGASSFEVEAVLKTYNLNTYFNSGFDPMIRGEINSDYRFYYNQKKRELKGKRTNGFSGNYFFLGGGLSINSRPSIINAIPDIAEKNWDFEYNLKTGLGIQRRIGNIGYADFKFGFKMNSYTDFYYMDSYVTFQPGNLTFKPFIDINLGIGLKSLKRPLFKYKLK